MINKFIRIGLVFQFILFLVISVSCSQSKKTDNSQETKADSIVSSEMKIGVALYSFNRFSFSEAIEKAKSTGVTYTEGFSFHELGGDFGKNGIAALDESGIKSLKNLLDSTGVKMNSMYADGKTLSEWEQLFKQAKALNMEFLVGEPDPKWLDDINRMAKDNNVLFAIHEHAKGISKYWHPDSALAALEGRDHLKICADIGHWVRSGLDPVECLKKAEGQIISVHVKDLDSSGNLDAKDVNIGEGVIPYPKVMEELKRQGFTGYIFIECEHDWDNNLKDVKESVNYITQLTQ